MEIFLIILAVIIVLRVFVRVKGRKQNTKPVAQKPQLSGWQMQLNTVWVFTKVNLNRLFRDRVALFFTFLFPLIFLFVFGSLSHSGSVSLRIGFVNESKTEIAKIYTANAQKDKVLNIDKSITTMSAAYQSMSRGQIDAAVELPPTFGQVKNGLPGGQAIIHYTEDNEQAEQALASILQSQFASINAHFVKPSPVPFKVKPQASNAHSLTAFDYTFTGMLGFAILGAGIFGPMNVFPELKKMGILRRLHTTPLRVWQFFLSNMLGQAVTGLMSLAVMLAVAVGVYHIKIVGNLGELAIFLVLGIVLILGIGLALGGWAKNERQVAPLGNIIVFPMMFLTGVFFPRFLMPQLLQSITNYMPLTPVIDGARMILTEGKSIFDLGPQLAVMGVWMVIIYAIAFKVFRWE